MSSTRKVPDLTALTTPVSGDLLHIVDISDTTEDADGTSKQVTKDNFTKTIATDTISENTTGSGVTVDSLLVKDGGLVAAGAVDMNGKELILDADADTTITADTDDQIDIAISGADDFQFTANTFTALSGSTIKTDTISEGSGLDGVTIEGVKCEDNTVYTTGNITTSGGAVVTQTISEFNPGTGVTIDSLNIKDGAPVWDGWINATGTWTYSAYDSTHRTATITVPTDATTTYSLGMRVRFTQPTDGVKHGIITKIAATVMTVFMESGDDFDNEAITAPYYSTNKAPFGFSLDPANWKIEVTDITLTSTNPAAGTYYNLGGNSINIPIGVWTVYLRALCKEADTALQNFGYLRCGLSTANNTLDTPRLIATGAIVYTASGSGSIGYAMTFTDTLTLTTADQYFLNMVTNVDTDTISLEGRTAEGGPVIISATCAYL